MSFGQFLSPLELVQLEADAASGMTRLVRSLNVNGTRIPYMMELVSALNSRIMGRIFELVVPAELRDRVCLLVMGSEGRREQLKKLFIHRGSSAA